MQSMFLRAKKFQGYGVAEWDLKKIPLPMISNMFSASLVPDGGNNNAIWYKWQDKYGYSDQALKLAGLNKPEILNTSTETLTASGVSTTAIYNLAKTYEAIVTKLLARANAALNAALKK